MELLFLHGALVRDGDWWWQPAAELLWERTGIRSRAIALPSCGETTPDEISGGIVADASALRSTLDGVDSAIVVGHSYGGTVIAEAGHHPAIAHLLYVSSYLPEIGEAQSEIMSGETDPVSIGDNGDGTLAVSGYDASSFGGTILTRRIANDAGPRVGRVTSQAASAFMTPTSAAGWKAVDSTYLVCAEDRSTSTRLQRFHAARATRSIELPTGHHPFITRPELVVEQLEAMIHR